MERKMAASKVEEKKQACRDILELGMNGLTDSALGWFEWTRFFGDLEKALEELEIEAKTE